MHRDKLRTRVKTLEDEKWQREEQDMIEKQNKILGVHAGATSKVSSARAAALAEERMQREELRREMLSQLGDLDLENDFEFLESDQDFRWRFHHLTRRCTNFFEKKMPLSKDVQAIEARYGSAVACYFRFFREFHQEK